MSVGVVRVDGRRAARAVAALVVVSGLLLAGSGALLWHIGDLGASRYDRASGRLARVFSDDDRSYYDALRAATVMGRTAAGAGAAVALAGVLLVASPAPLVRFLGRGGGPDDTESGGADNGPLHQTQGDGP